MSNSKKKNVNIETVGDLRRALREFPDDYKLKISLTNEVDNAYFINGICDHDDVCEIEIL